MISLTSYAVVCSNVVVHNSDHNSVMVAIVDYYTTKVNYAKRLKTTTVLAFVGCFHLIIQNYIISIPLKEFLCMYVFLHVFIIEEALGHEDFA